MFEGPPPPTPAAAVLCERPGFPRDIGQDWYRLVDMDQGTSCTVFLEQDVCVLAIFRDCTDTGDAPREWQGVATVERTVELTPVYPQGASGVTVPRPPACCIGAVTGTGTPTSLRLDCRLDVCNSSNRFHTGLFLTRATENTPALSTIATESVAGPASTARAASGLWDDAREEGWLGWTDGLYVRGRAGNAIEVGTDQPAALMAQDAGAVFAAAGLRLARIDKVSRTVDAEIALPSEALAVARTASGVVVAVRDGERTALYQFEDADLAQINTNPVLHDGQATGLTVRASDGSALMTIDDPPRLVVLSSTLAASQTVPMSDLRVLRVAEVVPSHPRWIDDERVGFIGACYRGAAKTHCYYEHTLGADDSLTERIGVPDEARLASFAVTQSDVWLGGVTGAVHRIGRQPFEPRPGDVTVLPDDASVVIDTGEALWVLSVATGRMTVLSIAP